MLYNCCNKTKKNARAESIKSRYRFIRFKHLVHRATWNLFNQSTHLSLVLDLPVSLFDAIWTGQHQQRAAARTYYEKQNLCKRRTVNAPHRTRAGIHTYKCVYTRASPQLPITTTNEHAYSPRANTFFLLTATTAHTYDAPAMTNSNTWMGKRTREGDRTIGLDLRELRQSRERESLYRFVTNLITIVCNHRRRRLRYVTFNSFQR